MKTCPQRPPISFICGVLLLALLLQTSTRADICTNAPSGLVSWWPAEGTPQDIVGPNNGTLLNATRFVSGQVGQAFSFDGVSQAVEIPDDPTLSFTNELTVELWYRDGGVPAGAYAGLVAKRPLSGACNFGLSITAGSPGSFLVYFLDPKFGSYQGSTFSPLPPAGGWHHLAATFRQLASEQIEIRSFIDGQLVETTTNSGSMARTTNNSPVYIGCSNPPGGEFFKGNIDEVSIYSRALLDSEIAGIYAAGSAGKCVPPSPPTIYSQPVDQHVFVGQSTTFSVGATGTAPLRYQWALNGTAVPGATNSQLVLTNIQLSDAGTYSVAITNALGGLLSSSAQLSVYAVGSGCATPPSGITAWWPGEKDARDIVGTNSGVFDDAQFSTGEVGEAFNFDGSGKGISVPASPSLDVGQGSGMTIEAWINPTDSSTGRPIVEWAPGPTSGGYGVHFYANATAVGVLYANLIGTDGTQHVLQSAGGLLTNNGFQHVALTYEKGSGVGRLFLNGTIVAESKIGSFTPQTSKQLYIGYRPIPIPYAPIPFKGQIDEVSLYSRALSPAEVQFIFSEGSAGKCWPPVPPQIVIEPTNQLAIVGQSATLSVYAAGAQPLGYQWSFNGTNIDGATDTSLTLTNLQLYQTGIYAVEVTNLYGVALSSNVSLTVNPPPPCTAAPNGLVSWWPGNGDATDLIGGQDGIFSNPMFAAGEVNQAFKFDTSGNNVRVPAAPSLDLGKNGGLSIEAWINPYDPSKPNPIVEWAPAPGSTYGVHFYAGGSAELYADIYSGGDHVIHSDTGLIASNAFQHVALTYDKSSGVARLYLNGALVAQSAVGTFTPQTTQDLYIGYRPDFVPFGPYKFNGLIDEVAVYSRALSQIEVQAIYAAGGSGKCPVAIVPAIVGQPNDLSVTVGQTATFFVNATGSARLAYDWSFNGVAIPGATNASLVLTNVMRSQAGVYAVQVTNLYGSVVSSNATLVVNFPPAPVDVVNTSRTAGQLVTVPVVLVANGNENAIGFSLNFPPTLLTNVGVTLGTGATGGSLQFNSGTPGTVGIAVALPSGATFAPGTQEVAEVSFISAVSAKAYTAQLTFGDQPTRRELSDPDVVALAANFNGGQVALNRAAFEADVAPRPDGDGTVSIVDWVQIGRYVAALDSPTNASEFQRADCAPRSTAGDGLLTVSDWVQAGRYVTGLDPITLAAGPAGAPAGAPPGPLHKRGTQTLRTVSVLGPLVFQGQTATAEVDLQAQGDENAVGLSLSFDPAAVAYTGALLGIDATSATMDVNDKQATNGRVGIILALPSDASFSPGTRQLVRVSFQAVTTNSVQSPVALTDVPVFREVADTNALPVTATYTNGVISLNPRPAVGITQSAQSITLAWPTWATNYLLQSAASNSLALTTWTNLPVAPVLTNNSFNATVPVSGSVQFYRLQHQ